MLIVNSLIRRIIAYGLGMIVFNAYLYGCWLYPLLMRCRALHQENIRLTQLLHDKERLAQDKYILDQKSSRMYLSYDNQIQQFTREKRMPALLDEMMQVGARYHLSFISVVPLKSRTYSDYRLCPIQMVLLGEYQSMLNFLSFFVYRYSFWYWRKIKIERFVSTETPPSQLKIRLLAYIYINSN